MNRPTYIIIQRIDWIRLRLENGGSLNCTDVAAQFDVSTKTAQRYFNLLRKHYRLPVIYDASKRTFFIEDQIRGKCTHSLVKCLCCGAEGTPINFLDPTHYPKQNEGQ
jgi:hypothetical protein